MLPIKVAGTGLKLIGAVVKLGPKRRVKVPPEIGPPNVSRCTSPLGWTVGAGNVTRAVGPATGGTMVAVLAGTEAIVRASVGLNGATAVELMTIVKGPPLLPITTGTSFGSVRPGIERT